LEARSTGNFLFPGRRFDQPLGAARVVDACAQARGLAQLAGPDRFYRQTKRHAETRLLERPNAVKKRLCQLYNEGVAPQKYGFPTLSLKIH
jgi:hypothetical protein